MCQWRHDFEAIMALGTDPLVLVPPEVWTRAGNAFRRAIIACIVKRLFVERANEEISSRWPELYTFCGYRYLYLVYLLSS